MGPAPAGGREAQLWDPALLLGCFCSHVAPRPKDQKDAPAGDLPSCSCAQPPASPTRWDAPRLRPCFPAKLSKLPGPRPPFHGRRPPAACPVRLPPASHQPPASLPHLEQAHMLHLKAFPPASPSAWRPAGLGVPGINPSRQRPRSKALPGMSSLSSAPRKRKVSGMCDHTVPQERHHRSWLTQEGAPPRGQPCTCATPRARLPQPQPQGHALLTRPAHMPCSCSHPVLSLQTFRANPCQQVILPG